MSTPYNYIANTGVIVPDVSDIQTQVQGEWQTAFGSDIALTADTPQGKMITAEVTARSRVAQMMAQLANMINPNQSGGVFLDALAALFGLERDAASFTQVPGVVISGTPNTLFQAGQLQAVSQSTGLYYTNTAAVQLSNTGSASVTFQCATAGANLCPADDLQIATQVFGWETITQATAGTPGTLDQSDPSFKTLRNNTLAKQGVATVEATVSALNLVPGVTSLQFLENIQNTQQTINGIVMNANSVWACVNGGSAQAVAMALLGAKTLGANWNGATSVTVTDPSSEQQYTVLFDRPTAVGILSQVTVSQGTFTGNLLTAIPQAIVDYSNGVIANDPGFVVGADVSPFDLVGAIYSECPGVFVSNVELAVQGGSPVFAPATIEIALNQIATIAANNVQVIVNP